jgi:trehalose/maltose hydrolase-like predicted phosphorylase
MDNTWFIEERKFTEEQRKNSDAIYTLANGYLGCRGFMEEDNSLFAKLGGIYIAGVFGRGNVPAWNGMHRELVNTANTLSVVVKIDQETVLPRSGTITSYYRCLNMKEGVLTRSFVWTGSKDQQIYLSFERFVSITHLHLIAQKITIEPINCNPEISLTAGINADVRNMFGDTLAAGSQSPGLKHLCV